MMTFDQIATATLDQLTDELAAAGWDSCETSIDAARESVARLLSVSGQAKTRRNADGQQNLTDLRKALAASPRQRCEDGDCVGHGLRSVVG